MRTQQGVVVGVGCGMGGDSHAEGRTAASKEMLLLWCVWRDATRICVCDEASLVT